MTLTPALLSALPSQTLDGALHMQARRTPERVALVDGERSWTYHALEDLVARLAGGLRAAGLGPGDRLAALVGRTWELPVLFLATARAGGVYVPVDPATDPARLEGVLGLGVAMFYDPKGVVFSDVPVLRRLPLDGTPLPPSGDPHAVCYWNMTSGSTGQAKAAPTTHAQVQWNTRACLETYRWRPDERYLCLFAPFAHPHEHWARPLTTGGTCVMTAATRPRTLLRVMRDQRISWLFTVPSILRLLALTATEPLPALRVCETGGALVDPALVGRAEATLGCQVMPIWGCTEATGVVLHVPPWDPERDLRSLGRPLAHYGASLCGVDADSGVGELALRGPAIVGGYVSGTEASRFAEGLYRTGDLVRRVGAEGYSFAGRLEDVIKVGGTKVYLVDVEQALRGHPGVADVAVVPARDDARGEVPRAVVVVADPSLTAAELVGWCRRHLRAEQVPRRMELVEALPRAASGKLDRRALLA